MCYRRNVEDCEPSQDHPPNPRVVPPVDWRVAERRVVREREHHQRMLERIGRPRDRRLIEFQLRVWVGVLGRLEGTPVPPGLHPNDEFAIFPREMRQVREEELRVVRTRIQALRESLEDL